MRLHQNPRARRTAKMVIRAVAVAWIVAWWVWLIGYQHTFTEVDAEAYWGLQLDGLYQGVRLGDQDAFLYSPAVALLFLPFSYIPYDVFYALFAAINLGALVYLLGWELAAVSLFIVPVSNEIARGNIHLLLGLAIVVGFRYPASWAWPLLTKATPGVGLLWFAVRREWRRLAVAIVVTGLVVAATFVLVPELWIRWFALLSGNADADHRTPITQVPLLPRLAIAAGVTVLAAWRGVPALVPVAAVIALPAIWVNSLSLLVAVVPLLRGSWRAAASDRDPDQLPIEARTGSPRLAPDDPP